jgi:hypothetical protein
MVLAILQQSWDAPLEALNLQGNFRGDNCYKSLREWGKTEEKGTLSQITYFSRSSPCSNYTCLSYLASENSPILSKTIWSAAYPEEVPKPRSIISQERGHQMCMSPNLPFPTRPWIPNEKKKKKKESTPKNKVLQEETGSSNLQHNDVS